MYLVIQWRRGKITALRRSWPGAAELDVELDGGGTVRALAYPELVGRPEVGNDVLLNTSALARGLGTGGYAFVVAIVDAHGLRGAEDAPRSAGHLVKARYTPLQSMVLSVDEQDSVHHDLLRDADSIDGLPVVVADLHSALPAIIAGARAAFGRDGSDQGRGRPPRIAYVMTDGGALPLWFSRTVAGLQAADWIDTTLTCGQAFGGDLEAVTLHSALLAAHLVCEADLVVVTQGPGNLGTDTRWGFSGVAVGDAINAVAALQGRPIATLRMSQADARDRHLGISHHSVTAYGRVACRPADLVLPPEPAALPPWWHRNVAERIAGLVAPVGLHRSVACPDADFSAILADVPVTLSTMGRGLLEDELSFTAAAAAGYWAGQCAAQRHPDRSA